MHEKMQKGTSCVCDYNDISMIYINSNMALPWVKDH